MRDEILFSLDCPDVCNDDVAVGTTGYLALAKRWDLWDLRKNPLGTPRPFLSNAVGEHPISVTAVQRGPQGNVVSVTIANEDQHWDLLDPVLLSSLRAGTHPRLHVKHPERVLTEQGEVRFRNYRGFYQAPELFFGAEVYVLQLGRTSSLCPCTLLDEEHICARCGVHHWSAPEPQDLEYERHLRAEGDFEYLEPRVPSQEWGFQHLKRVNPLLIPAPRKETEAQLRWRRGGRF